LSGSVNKHDRAIVLILALLDEGISRGRDIVACLQELGLNPKHVGITLSENCGNAPARHLWRHGANQAYRKHADAK